MRVRVPPPASRQARAELIAVTLGALRATLFTLTILALLGAASARASEPFSDRPATNAELAVNARGEALVTYRTRGRVRRVLVWGAVDALPPSADRRQVRFRYDYAGGWGKYRRAVWPSFRNACRPYEGPPLDWVVAACTAPDGSHWALQAWRRYLPHRGFPPWKPEQGVRELRISHWTGEIARLEAHADWAFGGGAHGLFGRLTYRGLPVHGFSSTRNGEPRDRFGRNLYIDTYDSAYGRGWHRETSILFRKPTGAFCYSFWPTRDVSLPGRPRRPAGNGTRYRITVAGPGATPDVVWEGRGLPDFDARNREHVEHERQMDALFLRLVDGDRFCPTQR